VVASILKTAEASIQDPMAVASAADVLGARGPVARSILNWATCGADRTIGKRALQVYRFLAANPTRNEIAALSCALLTNLALASRGGLPQTAKVPLEEAASEASTLCTLAVEVL